MRVARISFALALIACGSSSKPATDPAARGPAVQPVAAEPPAAAAATVPAPAPTPAPPPPLPEAPPWGATTPRAYVLRALPQFPADATFVLGVDAPRLAQSPLGAVIRAGLDKAVSKVPASCSSLNAVKLGQVMVAGGGQVGPAGASTAGSIVVLFGPALQERELVPCAKDVIKGKGGELKSKQVGGRTLYFATGTPRDNGWLAWTRSGLVLAGSEAWLTATLDPTAQKIRPELADAATHADHGRMIWLAAQLGPDLIRAVGLPDGIVTAPVTVRAGIDIAEEIELDILVAFKTTDQANRAATQARTQVAQLRQDPAMQPYLSNVRLGVNDAEVRAIVRIDPTRSAALIAMLR